MSYKKKCRLFNRHFKKMHGALQREKRMGKNKYYFVKNMEKYRKSPKTSSENIRRFCKKRKCVIIVLFST